MNTKQHILLLGILSGYIQSALAHPLLDAAPNVFSLSLGPAWTNSGQTQTLVLQPNVANKYVSDHNTSSFFNGELFLGWEKVLQQRLTAQMGLALNLTSPTTQNGVIWQMANPLFDNETYHYKINHGHVAFKTKLIRETSTQYHPYLFGSLGVGFNRAYGFENIPLISQVVASPNFTPYTKSSFTYTVGAGIQRNLYRSLDIGLEYIFGDWGASQLNPAPTQTTSIGLIQDHTYYNGFNVSLTYRADDTSIAQK